MQQEIHRFAWRQQNGCDWQLRSLIHHRIQARKVTCKLHTWSIPDATKSLSYWQLSMMLLLQLFVAVVAGLFMSVNCRKLVFRKSILGQNNIIESMRERLHTKLHTWSIPDATKSLSFYLWTAKIKLPTHFFILYNIRIY